MRFDPARESGGAFAIRSVPQWERALLAQWFARTDRTGPEAVVAAYVSERSHDNPRLRNMIIIAEHAKHDVAFLIYRPDRKSTRLNSSHPSISYAVFCL